MATRTIRRTDLVGLSSVSFIRPQNITFSITDTKPSTNMYAFFDGVNVSKYVTPNIVDANGVVCIVTSASGSFSGAFALPPATFNTGARTFRIQDSTTFDTVVPAGSTVGSASAIFTANGIKKTFQETVTNITTNIITLQNNVISTPIVVRQGGGGNGTGDPLAQTFFTYGIKGGCFITKMDLFFHSKDPAIPVTLQIRNVVNGYPGPDIISDWASVSVNSANVLTSSTALTPTTFTFSRPIYLEEDKDYCFVLLSNSNKYNVWTSEFGKTSKETQKTIFEQPYIGTLFKSENNITWTAEQTEDIKFTMYRANFTTGSQTITYKANATSTLILGEDFSVVSGSSTVSARFKFQHGHKTGDKIVLVGLTGATYRGIPSATISNVLGFAVNVSDEYSLTFNCGANATSTGTLKTSGILNSIEVDSIGSGYTTASIVVSSPPSGVTATATPVINASGAIESVTITNPGSGYVDVPTIVFTGNGTGATFTPVSEAIFVSSVNRKYQNIIPIVTNHQPPSTRLVNTIKTSSEEYVTGIHEDVKINSSFSLSKNAVMVNAGTEATSFGGNPSTQMILRLESDNVNVSPVIDLTDAPRLKLHNFLVNPADSIVSLTAGTGWSAGVTTYVTGAHGRDVGDTVYITGASPAGYNGVFTIATVPSSTSFTVLKSVTPGAWVSGGTTNDTELTPASGNAKSRYLSTITTISTPSTGARVFVTGASTTQSSFDVFIRTSLSSNTTAHADGYWTKLSCPSLRNKSSTWSEYLEYEFSIDSLSQFDVYDIKIVLYSDVKYVFPKISNYRSIILAS